MVREDTFIRFFDSGKLDFATATSIKFSPEGFEHFYKSTSSLSSSFPLPLTYPRSRSCFADWANYKDRLLLRSQQVANSPELIRRLGIIAMNTPMEVDIYGHANSTCALGSRWVILSLK